MNKKMMMIGGAVVVVVTLILIFTLSGSSTRDMIVGKWDFPRGVLQLDGDGTAYAPGPRGDIQGTWSLGGDEKILTITMEGESEKFGLSSVSENKLCLSYQEDIKCFNKFGSNNGEDKASDEDYYSYGWSDKEIDDYMEVCMMGGNEAFCECSLDYIIDLYPNISVLEDDPSGAHQIGVEAGEECMHLLY